MIDQIQEVIANPEKSALIILNLIIIESLLSIDNATVLAIMVKDLPEEQRKKALKIGIWCAYIFRGIAMFFASTLIKIWWLKFLGGLYLIYIVFDWVKSKGTETKEDDHLETENSFIFKYIKRYLGQFWSTVIMVELMDVAFSIDNVFAAVAFTPNIFLVCVGVFIGILTMRLVAQYFTVLIAKYPFLESAAFIIIFILGLKLCFSIYEHYQPEDNITMMMKSHTAETFLSLGSALIFFIPLLTSRFLNYPKHK